ncbi:MAG: hypothetical protein M0Z77_03225 [Thermoplasmatales archaeon]|nr:hypothetical protein [Thermoplasmatales archaeon]
MEPVRIPITPELHKNRKKIVAIGTVVTIITVSIFLGLSLNTDATINVMGVEVHFEYAGSQSGYFGSPVQNYTWNFKTLDSGEIFHFTLVVNNYANVSHSINSITLSHSGFTLLSVNYPSPILIKPHSGQTLELTIQAPSHEYVGKVSVNILAM